MTYRDQETGCTFTLLQEHPDRTLTVRDEWGQERRVSAIEWEVAVRAGVLRPEEEEKRP